jgi:uncharacterized protein (TIGR04562 family)
MDRPDYLNKYTVNWETFDVMVGGKSSLDVDTYLGEFTDKEDADSFLNGYGFDPEDPIQSAEIFGNFQEALQFIKRYFLKEGNEDGLNYVIPSSLYTVSNISELLLMSTRFDPKLHTTEDAIWAGMVLKVMHTILHTDKDLRYQYFSQIQQQIFDRFYKFVKREGENLYLESDTDPKKVELLDFQTKAKKHRDSIIIKLLHKKNNVAEELFDRVGVRFITKDKFDSLRVLKFLYKNYIVIANNIKPSRSHNSLVDLKTFKHEYMNVVKNSIKNKWKEDKFLEEVKKAANDSPIINVGENQHSSMNYQAMHFTCRQLIKYKNPFLEHFLRARSIARDQEGALSEAVLKLDVSSVAKDIRFFYPFEVQITDEDGHKINTEGEASHLEYKKSQVESAMNRLFRPLIEFNKTNS